MIYYPVFVYIHIRYKNIDYRDYDYGVTSEVTRNYSWEQWKKLSDRYDKHQENGIEFIEIYGYFEKQEGQWVKNWGQRSVLWDGCEHLYTKRKISKISDLWKLKRSKY